MEDKVHKSKEEAFTTRCAEQTKLSVSPNCLARTLNSFIPTFRLSSGYKEIKISNSVACKEIQARSQAYLLSNESDFQDKGSSSSKPTISLILKTSNKEDSEH